MPAWKKPILLAMAHYGLFVGDTFGGAWGDRDRVWVELHQLRPRGPLGPSGPPVRSADVDRAPDGERRYIFDLRTAVDWVLALKVAAG